MCLKIKRELVLLHSFGRCSCDRMTGFSLSGALANSRGIPNSKVCSHVWRAHCGETWNHSILCRWWGLLSLSAVSSCPCFHIDANCDEAIHFVTVQQNAPTPATCHEQCPDMDVLGSVEASFPALHWIDIFGKWTLQWGNSTDQMHVHLFVTMVDMHLNLFLPPSWMTIKDHGDWTPNCVIHRAVSLVECPAIKIFPSSRIFSVAADSSDAIKMNFPHNQDVSKMKLCKSCFKPGMIHKMWCTSFASQKISGNRVFCLESLKFLAPCEPSKSNELQEVVGIREADWLKTIKNG